MPYVQVEDGFPEHPKAIDLSLAAKGLWLDGLCYANRQLTDGFVPAGVVRRAGGADDLVSELVSAGLWEPAAGGWTMHDYEDWQTTKAEIEAKRQQKADAGRLGGLAKAKHATSTTLAPAKQNGKQTPSEIYLETKVETKVEAEAEGENDDDARTGATAAPSVVEHPFALLESLCDELGEDVSVLSKTDRNKQLAVAKRLRDDGLSADDVRKMTRWLRSQSWVTGGIDLFLIQKQTAKWRLDGKPERAPPNGRASPSHAGMAHLRALAKGQR